MTIGHMRFGYRGGEVTAANRDVLMSGYDGAPAGVVRSGWELHERLAGRSVCYRRAPHDEQKQDNLRNHLLAQLAKERMQ